MLTRKLGEFASATTFDRVPAAAREPICAAFIDTVGVIVAGSREPAVSKLQEALGAQAQTGAQARVLLSAENRMPAQFAALIGGTAAHALDFDDVSLSSHPSAVLVPAILAEGEAVNASGADMITAYFVGYEIWANLFKRSRDYHRKGWHPTAVFGPVATAGAIVSLRRLSPDQSAHTLAIAASHASGLVANFGTMTKPLHAGMAAQNSIWAATLAQTGFTGAVDAIEHPQGYLSAIAPDGNPDREAEAVTNRDCSIVTHGLNVKLFPTCYATHRTIGAMIDLVTKHDLQSGDVAAIEAHMGRTQAAALRNSNPQTALEAKFSEEFAMACALVRRRVGLNELTDAVVMDPELRQLYSKVTTHLLDAQDPEDPVFSPMEHLIVRLNNGSVLEARDIRYAKGHARNPLTQQELRQKFEDCLSASGARNTDRLYDSLLNLDRLASAADIPSVKF